MLVHRNIGLIIVNIKLILLLLYNKYDHAQIKRKIPFEADAGFEPAKHEQQTRTTKKAKQHKIKTTQEKRNDKQNKTKQTRQIKTSKNQTKLNQSKTKNKQN